MATHFGRCRVILSTRISTPCCNSARVNSAAVRVVRETKLVIPKPSCNSSPLSQGSKRRGVKPARNKAKTNYGGKILQNNLSKINFMMSLLSKTGYLYIDNIHDNEKSLGFASAEGQKVPTLKTKTYIQSVTQEFPRFIKQVKMDGTGIAVIKATPENIAALEEYEPILNNSQVHRIPVTGILKQQMLQNIENNLY